ncbi:hypothetical protein ACFLWU_04265 [Chloroflexota bacterium]
MDTVRQLAVKWYWGELNDILVVFVASIGVGAFIQGVKYGIGYSIMTPEEAEVIVYKVFNVLSIPPFLSMLTSAFTFIVKGITKAFTE